MRQLGTTVLGLAADPSTAPSTTLDTATGDLLTWQLLASDPFYKLARVDVAGPTVTQTIQVPTPSGYNRDAGSAMIQMGADLVWNDRAGGVLVFRANLDGTVAPGPWLDITPEITTFGFLGAARIHCLNVDSIGRLYVWIVGAAAELDILRYGPDGSFDRRFKLLADLGGSAPSSHDAVPSSGSSAASRWPSPIGMDISADGSLAYVAMARVTGSGDASLQKQSIYKFDLANADPLTFVPPHTVFAQIDSSQTGYSPAGGGGTDEHYTIGNTSDIGSYVGLTVNPVDGTVAVQVATRTTRLVSTPSSTLTDDAHYYLYLYDMDGTLLSTTHIADSVPITGITGIPQGSYTYRFKVDPSKTRNMAWEPDGSEVYYWINLDDDATNASPPLQRTWLCNSSGKMEPYLQSSDPDNQENPFGYALSFAAPVAGCTVGSHNGDIYAYLPSPSTGGGIYRYEPLLGDLKEIIPVSSSESLPTAKTLRLQGGNLYAVGGTPGKLVKAAGVAPHTVTLLHDWTGNVNGDTGAESITFDSDGNIYVRLHGALGTGGGGVGTRAVVLYKLDPTGTILTRTVLPTDYDATAGFVWLTNDDKTLLYDCYRDADGFEVVKRYDLDADAPLADWYRMTSAYDTTAPYFSSTKPGAVYLSTRKLVRAVGNQQTESSVVDSTVGYRGSDRFLYESQHLVLGSFEDAGCDTDSDPDNVSLWIDSATADALYRFNIATGALTRTLSLADEGGTAYAGFPFAICGGAGGFGNPPPAVVSLRRRGGFPAFLS